MNFLKRLFGIKDKEPSAPVDFDKAAPPSYEPAGEPRSMTGSEDSHVDVKPKGKVHKIKIKTRQEVTPEFYKVVKNAIKHVGPKSRYQSVAHIARDLGVHPVTVGLIKRSHSLGEYRNKRRAHSGAK